MSKLLKNAVTAAVAVTLAAPVGFAQAGAGARHGTAGAARAAEALAATDAILGDVAKIRRLDVLKPVPSGLKSRSDIERMVLGELRESTSDREFADASAMLAFLGLVPAGFDLRLETTSLLTEQVAGFYAPKTRFFFLADWIPAAQQRAVIAHELTHALTDQHFDLRRLEGRAKGNADARLAAQALIEGDATAVMLQFSLLERGVAADLGALPVSLTDVLRAGSEGGAEQPVFDKAPEVLRESLQFPYAYGAGFVQRVLKAGGWQRVDACYAAPPASTEQVMHPEKYFADERPERVTSPDVVSALGAGWRRADEDVNGEFGYAMLLRPSVGPKAAETAAAGWSGDAYGFYVNNATGDCVYAHVSAWDSEADAEEFAGAYASRLALRFGPPAGPGPLGASSWSGVAGAARLLRRGRRVAVVEGTRATAVEAAAVRVLASI